MSIETNNKQPITPEIISKIVKKEITSEDLITIRNYFATSDYNPVREALVKSLGENLSRDQLHQLNSNIMKNAHTLLEGKDDKFLCRPPGMKFVKELLVLEAEKSGTKLIFDKAEDIPQLYISPEILDLYSILKETFYKPRAITQEEQLNKHMAESISFLISSNLIQKTDPYEKLSELKKLQLQHSYVANHNGEISPESFINLLIQKKLATLAKPLQSVGEVSNSHTADERTTTAIIKSLVEPIAQLIIDKSLKNSGQNPNDIQDSHKQKMQGSLSKNISAEDLLKKQNELIDRLSAQLKPKTLISSLQKALFPGNNAQKNMEQIVENTASSFSTSKQVTQKDQKMSKSNKQKKITKEGIGAPEFLGHTVWVNQLKVRQAGETLKNNLSIEPILAGTQATPPSPSPRRAVLKPSKIER